MTEFKDLDSDYSVAAEYIEYFKENGYIKLKDVLSPETLDYYREVISEQVKLLNTQHLPLEERDLYHRAFLQVSNIWRKNDIVKRFAFSRRLAKIAADLLEVSGVRIYHDQALYKEPGGGFTPWHADQQYWPLASEKSVTVWIPLQETPLEMGPLSFAMGSHKKGFARDLPIGEESETKIAEIVKRENMSHLASSFDLGEVSYHYGWTLHRAGPNSTDKARAVMTVIYMDEDMKLAEPANENQKVDRDVFCPGVKVGEVIKTDMNPLLFSYRNS